MTRSAEEIEREVEETRDALDSTVEALKGKMSPGQLIDELTQTLKGSGAGDMFANLGGQVKENPMALAMIGAGMAWLMMGKGGGHASPSAAAYVPPEAQSQFYGETEPQGTSADGAGPKDKVTGMASQASSAASSAASRVGEAASHMSHGVQGAASHAMHGAQGMGGHAAHAGQKLQRTFMDTLEQEPLIIGALGLALGTAIGASLPPSRVEDRTFGALRDKVLDEGKARAQEGVQQAKDVAQAAYESVLDEAQQQGLVGAEDGGTMADKAESVVRAGADAVRERLEEGRAH